MIQISGKDPEFGNNLRENWSEKGRGLAIFRGPDRNPTNRPQASLPPEKFRKGELTA